MPAWLVTLLNPLNWWKIATGIKMMLAAIVSVIDTINAYLQRRKAEKKKEEIEQAGEELKKADEVTDDQARIQAKADALCKLEKTLDPSSTCDAGDGDNKLPK